MEIVTREQVRELRENLVTFCENNNIEFDTKISTRNLLIRARKEGFETDIEFEKPEVKPEPKPEVKPEPKPEVKPEPKPEVKPELKPEAKPEPKPEAKPEPKPEVKQDNSWLWMLILGILLYAVITLIRQNNE
jgi:cell division protein FtsN